MSKTRLKLHVEWKDGENATFTNDEYQWTFDHRNRMLFIVKDKGEYEMMWVPYEAVHFIREYSLTEDIEQ